MRRIKLAILSEYYPSSETPNSGAFVHARARAYQALGHDTLVLIEAGEGGTTNQELDGVCIKRSTDLETATETVRRFAPDAIALHFPYYSTPSTRLGATVADQYPVVAWIHGYEASYTGLLGYHEGFKRWLSFPHDWLKLRHLKHFLSRCHAVVYVSDWLRESAERWMNFQHPNSSVIPNPVDITAFAPPIGQRRGQELRGLALRSLRPIYGLDVAIRAYAAIESTQLTIVGTGPLESELRRLARRTGSRVQIEVRTLRHAEVPELLQQYDYFVAPSRNDTQGVTMCEAMACGMPAVATRVGGIPEFVRDGVDGYLVPPEDPDSLRDAVLRLVEDPSRCREMGRNARARIIELCSSGKIIPRELRILQSAAKRT